MKTKEEIIKGNKLIAEFMDLHPIDFHIDWRVLMPVVEKIDSLKLPQYLSVKAILEDIKLMHNLPLTTPIKEVHLAVVKFIAWYNEQQ